MKNFKIVLAVFFLVFSNSSSSVAKEKSYSVEGFYRHFENNYSPKELFIYAQKTAVWLSKMCDKGTKLCKEGLNEFNGPKTKRVTLDPDRSFLMIVDLELDEVIAHPNPKLHKIIGVKNLGTKLKDHSGRYYIVEAYSKYKKSTARPRAIFYNQYSTWIMGITKVRTPLYALTVLLQVPGTTYQLQGFMPLRATSIREADQKVSEIEKYTEEWMIDEYKNLAN